MLRIGAPRMEEPGAGWLRVSPGTRREDQRGGSGRPGAQYADECLNQPGTPFLCEHRPCSCAAVHSDPGLGTGVV